MSNLLSQNPSVEELLDFYFKSSTLKIESILNDPSSFIYFDQKNKMLLINKDSSGRNDPI